MAATNGTLAANATSFVAAGLAASSAYNFRLKATGATGDSDFLFSGDIVTKVPAPSSLVVGVKTTSSVSFSWTNNLSTATGFDVQRCQGASCANFSTVFGSPLSASATSHTELGLSLGVVYTFRIRALSQTGASDWLTSGAITLSGSTAAAATCESPKTTIIDAGQKGSVVSVGRGLHSATKIMPGTSYPAVAYYDGSASGGNISIKYSYWDGSKFRIESVAGDSLVAAGSATFVKLAFLNTGVPMIFWTTGASTVKMAMRSAATSSAGTWTAAVIDTVAGALSRAIEVSVSPLDHVGVVYLTNTAVAGRTRFISCNAPCSSPAGFTTMTGAADTIEASNIIAGTVGLGMAWCKNNASSYYPVVTYTNATNVRYATCAQASLTSCAVAAGWTGANVVAAVAATVNTKLYIDSTSTTATPKILARNAAGTLLAVYEGNTQCNTPTTAFTANPNTFGTASTGNAWFNLLVDSSGKFHVVANEAATSVTYFNSTTPTLSTTTWNAAGTIDTIALPAASLGAGGADISAGTGQIYASYGGAATPFNLLMGIVNDYTFPSNSASAIYYSVVPDTKGNILLGSAGGQVRNVSAAVNSTGKAAVAYVDYSVGAAANAKLKFTIRDGSSALDAWPTPVLIPNTGNPMMPSLAFDHNDLPWISYYDGNNFRYYLVTNSSSDGSGTWTTYQFPLGAKTATAAAPATDDTALAMYYSSGVAQPFMIVMNSTAAGGTGIRAARLNPATGTFGTVITIDALGASWGTRLTSDFDTSGNVVVAYYDLTTTTVKYNHSSNGTNWLVTSPQVSALNSGREGLSIRINSSTARPAVSYYDRANNRVHYNACTAVIANCQSAGNWSASQIESAAGVSTITQTTYEQVLSTSLSFDSSGFPFVAYMKGSGSTSPALILSDKTNGTFVPVTLNTSSAANVAGAAGYNLSLTGFNVSSVRDSFGNFFSAYVGPNNYLYGTSCGN